MVTRVSAPLSEVLTFRKALDTLTTNAKLFGWDTAAISA